MNAIIADFGMARDQRDRVSVTHSIYAKPPSKYAKKFLPESHEWSSKLATTRDDMYALGIVLLETITTGRINALGQVRYDTYWNLKEDIAALDFEFETLIKPRLRNTGCTKKQARDIIALVMDCLSCIENDNSPLAHEIVDRLQSMSNPKEGRSLSSIFSFILPSPC
ncbi:hypothetical protein LIER_34050 [Lithospermum erythrorhizon]|uniref:Protein kinase domain-containing protein n=1 Tax=Lithospermum erythrorhizon TaxID=34254 RepID=A0AAV3S2B3_LITER